MSDKNWENVKDLFSEAIEKPPEERDSFLEKACADQSLREEVRQLLRSYEEDDEFMENAAVGEVADIIVAETEENLFDELVGRYEIKSLLGEGGMGKVYLAKDTQLERLAAVKILSTYYSDDEHRIKRFFQEAKSASALNHPNILTIYELGNFKDTHFIAAEYVKGETLRYRQKRKRLSLSEIAKISLQVVSALKAAHEAKIVHRDIKPENIMIRKDGLVKILDFGLAKLVADKQTKLDSQFGRINLVNTAPRVVLGTVAYMSPEQARGKQTDFRTDIWSFGVCLYELLAGFSPFNGETMNDQIAEILTAEPKPLSPEIPSELKRIVGKCLKKNADERYRNADELLTDLTIFESSLSVSEPTEKITSYTEVQNTQGNRFRTVFTQLTAPIFSRSVSLIALASVLSLSLILGVFGIYNFRKNSVYTPKSEAVRWFKDANEAARNGNDFKAQKMLEQAVRLDEKYLPAQAKLAEIWFNRDYEDKAAQTMLKVTELIPQLKGLSENEEIYIQAVTATVRRDYQNALTKYEKLAENAPENEKVFALFDVGKSLEKLENSKRATETFEEVVRRDPQFAAAYVRLAYLYWFDEKRDQSLDAFQKAEKIYSSRSDYDGLAALYYLKGGLFGYNDEFPEAVKNLEKSLELSKATNNLGLEIKTMLALGGVKYSVGENQQAQEIIKEGLSLAQTENLEYFATTGLIDLGMVYTLKGDYAEAEKNAQQALQISRVNGSKSIEAQALTMLGSIALDRVKPREAVSYIEPALKFYDETNSKPEKARCLLILGISLIQTGKYDRAVEILKQLSGNAVEANDLSLQAQAEENIGNALILTGNYSEALDYIQKSLDINQNLGLNQSVGYNQASLSLIFNELGRLNESAKLSNLSEQTAVKSEDVRLAAEIGLIKANKALYENDFSEAIKQSRFSVEKIGDKNFEIIISANLICSLAELRRGNITKADEYFSKAEEVLNNSENPKTFADFQLVKSEILIKKNLPDEALSAALNAGEKFASLKNKPSEWRSVSMALIAVSMLKDTQKISEFKSESATLFNSLNQLWGNENFQKFRLRKDIELLLSQTDKIEG